MASEICMNCFSVKGQYEVCPYCGYVEGTPPKQPHYLTPGTIIGNHFIVGPVIGVGGFGITYKCFDTTLGVVVAVKEFFPVGLVNRAPGESRVGLLSGDKAVQYKDQLKRFLMEARSVAQFGNAKDIVNVFDFFEENGTAYIIMEYIDGVLLKDYMEKMGRIEPEYAMGIIMPIIEAVKKIHSKGIIHQDISPDNIFIIDENTIKIFDFGAARLNETKEGAGEKVIKVGYSAPEQYRDKNKQGYFTDVYSVGAIMYQLLTGHKPMESTEREHKDRLKSPLELGIKISGNEDRAVMEALAIQPELRYQGIQQFEEALLNKRIAEYPKDKIKKRKLFRNGIIGVSALLALTVTVGIGLYFTVFKGKQDEFYTSRLHDKQTQITVWVENDAQAEKLEKLTHFQELSENQDEKVKEMLLGMKDTGIHIEVQEDMDEAIKKAAEEGNMPDMFLSDHVSNLKEYDLVNLGETVYKELDTNDYYFLSENEYQTYYPDMTSIPTGLDTLLVYSMGFEYNKDKALEDSVLLTTEEINGEVELTTLIPPKFDTAPSAEDISKYAYFQTDDDSIANAIVLMKNTESEEDVQSQLEGEDTALKQNVSNIIDFENRVTKKKFRVAKKTDKGNVFGSNIIAGVTYRSALKDAIDDKYKEKSKNPLNEYIVSIATHNDKILVSYEESYSISKKSTSDEQYLCQRLLWLMLNVGQEGKASSQSDTAFPIMKTSLQNFKEYNPKFAKFAELIEQRKPCILVGSCMIKQDGETVINVGTPEIREFTEKMRQIKKEKNVQETAILEAVGELLDWEPKEETE